MSFQPQKILVPVSLGPDDDLDMAKKALDVACDLAKAFSGRITLLHISHTTNPSAPSGMDISGSAYSTINLVLQSRLKESAKKLEALEHEAEYRGVEVDARLVDSLDTTVQQICETANDVGADLIVLCTHGRKGLAKLFLGSVADKLVKRAETPVLLLHP